MTSYTHIKTGRVRLLLKAVSYVIHVLDNELLQILLQTENSDIGDRELQVHLCEVPLVTFAPT